VQRERADRDARHETVQGGGVVGQLKTAVKCLRCGRWFGTVALYNTKCPYCGRLVSVDNKKTKKYELQEDENISIVIKALNGGQNANGPIKH
jgi:DNA-directed RNA polymerase subunit RPC12/RpoP